MEEVRILLLLALVCMLQFVCPTVRCINRNPVSTKLKVKVMKNLIYHFQWGYIDHSNPYIHSTTVLCDMYMYCIERSVNISITRITMVKNKYFCYVAMISLHMLTFRLMVTDFCSLVILIHNTLLGQITISSTRTKRVNIIPLFPST